jgi:hypothetical protein
MGDGICAFVLYACDFTEAYYAEDVEVFISSIASL